MLTWPYEGSADIREEGLVRTQASWLGSIAIFTRGLDRDGAWYGFSATHEKKVSHF